jgi:hypothetical protein
VKEESDLPKPMKWKEAIAFLLRFASIEAPEKLRQGDRLNLFDDLRRYLEDDGEGQLAQELAKAEAEPAQLKKVIEVVRTIVEAAADHKEIDIPLGKTTITFHGQRLGDERRALSVDGSLIDAVADGAANDLSDVEPWQICRCPECTSFFVAGRKGQIYCTHKCANSAASREYRASHASRRAAREKSRYQKRKVAGAKGPKES